MISAHAGPTRKTVNAAYYSKILRSNLVQGLQKKRPYLAENLNKINFHQDNAPWHTSLKTPLKIDLLGFNYLKHLSYSPF